MNELEQQTKKIRSYRPDSISQIQTQIIPPSNNIAQTKSVPRLQSTPQPMFNQEKIIKF